MDDCTRRQLLGRCAAVAAAPVLVPLAGCARRVETLRKVYLPAAPDGRVAITPAAAPELTQIGGAVLACADGENPVLVARSVWGYLALDARCTHAGCEVTWVPEDKQAECPCHGSRFASDGTVLAPPATGNLTAFDVAADPLTLAVIVDLRAILVPGGAPPLFAPVDADGKLRVAVADHPELQITGGSVVGFAPGLGYPLAVIRAGATEMSALDATCTHQQCAVTAEPVAHGFTCFCHGSRYAQDGRVLAGPAAAPLGKVTVESFDGKVATIAVR